MGLAVCPGSGISLRVGFDGGELWTAREEDGVIRGEVGVEIVLDLFVGEVVVVVVVGDQRENGVECGIEGEAVEEVVEGVVE